MSIRKSEVVAALKEERRTITQQLESVDVALRAFGVSLDEDGPRSQSRSREGQDISSGIRRKRVINGPATEAQVRHVLSQSPDEALTAQEIHERGMFEQSISAIPHACRRMDDVETALVDGRRVFSLATSV